MRQLGENGQKLGRFWRQNDRGRKQRQRSRRWKAVFRNRTRRGQEAVGCYRGVVGG